jgi:hypothetical protein
MSMVTREMWVICLEDVRQQSLEVVVGLICELKWQILVQELLNATRAIYPQYWLALEVEITFLSHLVILNTHFTLGGLLKKRTNHAKSLLKCHVASS